jgi:hypothetical protein
MNYFQYTCTINDSVNINHLLNQYNDLYFKDTIYKHLLCSVDNIQYYLEKDTSEHFYILKNNIKTEVDEHSYNSFNGMLFPVEYSYSYFIIQKKINSFFEIENQSFSLTKDVYYFLYNIYKNKLVKSFFCNHFYINFEDEDLDIFISFENSSKSYSFNIISDEKISIEKFNSYLSKFSL